MAKGIKDKVAIIGMGCARFGERWNDDAEQLMVEAFQEALADAGVETAQIDAAWLSVGFDAMNIGPSGIPLAMASFTDKPHVSPREGNTNTSAAS